MEMTQTQAAAAAPACHGCRYYLVTWDVRFPYGCRAHAFKSKKPPAVEVFEASGLACLLFAPKTQRRTSGEPEPAGDSASFSKST